MSTYFMDNLLQEGSFNIKELIEKTDRNDAKLDDVKSQLEDSQREIRELKNEIKELKEIIQKK